MAKFYEKYVKRSIDAVSAAALLIILSPVFGVIACAIKADDGGPVFFKQNRIGKEQKIFQMYKFRSMVTNAESMGPLFTVVGDKRITKIGRVLRHTSLDELPQLVNILKGEMSFIGPRPHCLPNPGAPPESDDYYRRFKIKPGLSGLAQTNGRSLLNVEQGQYYDLKYVNEVSFILDLQILLKTIVVVLKREGTN